MHAPIHNSFKGNRVPENNSNQGGGRKLSTLESFNFLKKRLRKTLKMKRQPMVMDCRIQIVKMTIMSKAIYRFSVILIKNSNLIPHRNI